ncbi:MAG: metallophosphoesterase [Ignavibacteriaceae bacterium]|nr:metallophosphoesterase [Ignavibacteria bacterium]MEB2330447.1 metallophosphoesterase [Ignavibacteriaceae bacterium]OQY77668.1 MAG: hypothetical protein B6D43_03960 [Ignavibacteriales bacterium UTCHB1]
MKFNKTHFHSLFAIIIFIGIFAMNSDSGIINRVYAFSRQGVLLNLIYEDSSAFSPDGPVIIYQNEKIVRYQVISDDGKISTITQEIKKGDSLYCYVDATSDIFKFKLQDTLLVEDAEFPMPEKILAISDIEGNFRGLKMILQGNKIIDEKFNWIFGNNHLVLVGDFFDRGLNVTECLWLIYKLEYESMKVGGKVHFLLGNHELMNLKGQLKYLRNKYKVNADSLNLDYSEWYSQNSELGRWLRTKNSIEKIGSILFVHAGINKNFPKEFSLQEINDSIRKCVDIEFDKDQQRSNVFIGSVSPLWYRGIAKQEETQYDVDNTLLHFKADKMIIGHTIVDEIKYLYNQKVIDIDLYHRNNSDRGEMHALWIEDGKFYSIDNYGVKSAIY